MRNDNVTAVAIVQRLINSGAFDQITIANLKDSLQLLFEEVEYLSKKKYRTDAQHADLVDNLHVGKALCVVLGYYGCDYTETLAELNKIESSLMKEFV